MSYILKQCVLQKDIKGGFRQLVSYIPAEFAKKNKVLKLRDNDVWEDGWKVISVGGEIQSDDVADIESLHKRARKHSDRMRNAK